MPYPVPAIAIDPLSYSIFCRCKNNTKVQKILHILVHVLLEKNTGTLDALAALVAVLQFKKKLYESQK